MKFLSPLDGFACFAQVLGFVALSAESGAEEFLNGVRRSRTGYVEGNEDVVNVHCDGGGASNSVNGAVVFVSGHS